MEAKNMLHQQLSRLLGRRQLLEGNKVSHLVERVSDGKNVTEFPPKQSNPVTKSMDMWDHG